MPADPTHSDVNFPASFSSIREQLACPTCHGDLRLDEVRLQCAGCGRIYPVVDGIPVLIPSSPARAEVSSEQPESHSPSV